VGGREALGARREILVPTPRRRQLAAASPVDSEVEHVRWLLAELAVKDSMYYA
jgi:hypothetical protein